MHLWPPTTTTRAGMSLSSGRDAHTLEGALTEMPLLHVGRRKMRAVIIEPALPHGDDPAAACPIGEDERVERAQVGLCAFRVLLELARARRVAADGRV